MNFGCHAVLFKERIKSETEVILKGLSETGFGGVEIGLRFFGAKDKEYLVNLLNKYNMQLSGLHVGCPLKKWIENEDECFANVMVAAEFVKDMPNKNIILSGGKAQDCDLKVVAENINKAAVAAYEMGVKVNYHNHSWEFQNDGTIYKALVEYAPKLNFALDLGWVYAGGFDPVNTVEELGGRVSYVHLRDPKEKCGQEFVDLGEGIFDFVKLLATLKKVLPDNGWVVVEYEQGEQDFERYKKAKEFLDSVKY